MICHCAGAVNETPARIATQDKNMQTGRLTDRDLVELILSDPQRREAVEQLARMLDERQRQGYVNGKYEVTVVGRQISSAVYQHRYTHTLPERVGERVG